MEFMDARVILQKEFFLGDYGTCFKSVSGRKEALLKKLFFLNRPNVHVFSLDSDWVGFETTLAENVSCH